MVWIWEQELSQHKKLKKLPCIIPVVFYHGARKWVYRLNFASYVDGTNELKAYIPDFQTLMFNLQKKVNVETFQGGLMVQTALKAFKYALKGLSPYLGEILKSLPNLPVDPKSQAFILRLLEYIIQVGGDARAEDLEEELQSVESDLSREVYMTIEEQILQRGKIEGTILEKQQILLRLLEKKFGSLDDDNKRYILDNTDSEKLDSAIDLILDAESIMEVLSPLT